MCTAYNNKKVVFNELHKYYECIYNCMNCLCGVVCLTFLFIFQFHNFPLLHTFRWKTCGIWKVSVESNRAWVKDRIVTLLRLLVSWDFISASPFSNICGISPSPWHIDIIGSDGNKQEKSCTV